MKIKSNTYYQHRYGGIYRVDEPFLSKSTVDQSEWVVYTHFYPFEQTCWHRPVEEFTDGRFIELTSDQVLAIINGKNKEEFKLEIGENKRKRMQG